MTRITHDTRIFSIGITRETYSAPIGIIHDTLTILKDFNLNDSRKPLVSRTLLPY